VTDAVEVLHAVLSAALLAWAGYNHVSLRHWGADQALWLAMTALGVGEALHVEWLYRRLDAAAGPGWATVVCHAAGLAAAFGVLELLNALLGGSHGTRLANAVLGAAALATSALPWALNPPSAVPAALVGNPTYYDSTWRSALHWSAFLGYLGWSLASASFSCARYARGGDVPPRVRPGMLLVSVGTGVGLLYAVGHGLVELAWWHHRGAPLARFDAAMDAVTLGPAIILIALGAVWKSLCAVGDAIGERHFAWATRRRLGVLRPYWESLVEAMPDVSSFPDLVRDPNVSPERLSWQQARLITEIYDAMRRLVPYVTDEDRRVVRAKVAEHGLRGDDARAATDYICIRLSLQRRCSGAAPVGTAHEPELPAINTAAAATRVVADLRRIRRRRIARTLTVVSQEPA